MYKNAIGHRFISTILLSTGPVLWAGNFVVGRAVHDLVEPFVLNYLRWSIAALILTPVIVYQRRAIAAELRRNIWSFVTLALLGIVGFNWVLYTGLSQTEGSIGGIVFSVTPFLILLLASAWTGKKPPTKAVFGSIGAFFGVALVLWDFESSVTGAVGATGPALVFASAVLLAVYSVQLQTSRIRLSATATFATTVWLGFLVLTPFALVPARLAPVLSAPAELFEAAAYLGVGASVVAFCSWHAGIARVGAANAAIFMQLVPFFAVILSAIFLDETLDGAKLLGLGIIAASLAFTQFRWRPSAHDPSSRTIER